MPVDPHHAPLAPQWLGAAPATHRAGDHAVVRVSLRNGGRATWRSHGADGLQLSYHWLDPLGNPIVWDGPRTPFPAPVPPGDELSVDVAVHAPRPPGRYLLRFDLVEEHHFWLEEIGCATLDVDVDVQPRLARRRLAVVVHGGDDVQTTAALGAQREPIVTDEPEAVAHLAAGAVPPPDWSAALLDAHEEGWAAVGTAVVVDDRRRARTLRAWAPGGRNPRFDGPLLLPSLLVGLEPTDHLGLPAYGGPDALFDGRVAVRLPRRSGRRPT